jgi:hypothetical protein
MTDRGLKSILLALCGPAAVASVFANTKFASRALSGKQQNCAPLARDRAHPRAWIHEVTL